MTSLAVTGQIGGKMSKILRQFRCGRLVQAVVYTIPIAGESQKIRKQKQKASTAARERLNARTSFQKLERTLANNFDNGDLFLTGSFDDRYLPEDRAGAVRRARSFLGKLRDFRKARGHPLHYIYVVEGCYPGGRLHIHIVVNATGDDFEEIGRLWGYGNIELQRLTFDRERTYEDLASYLTKEPREWGHPHVGDRTWVPSLGLVKSEPETDEVPDILTLTAPPEALVVSKEGPIVNGYGEWCWIKYLLPYDPTRKNKKARCCRKKKE